MCITGVSSLFSVPSDNYALGLQQLVSKWNGRASGHVSALLEQIEFTFPRYNSTVQTATAQFVLHSNQKKAVNICDDSGLTPAFGFTLFCQHMHEFFGALDLYNRKTMGLSQKMRETGKSTVHVSTKELKDQHKKKGKSPMVDSDDEKPKTRKRKADDLSDDEDEKPNEDRKKKARKELPAPKETKKKPRKSNPSSAKIWKMPCGIDLETLLSPSRQNISIASHCRSCMICPLIKRVIWVAIMFHSKDTDTYLYILP